MRRPYAPDDSGMLPQDPVRNRGGNGNGNGYNAPSFFTGAETRTLAQDLADEFGGRAKSWRRDLNWQPKTFSFGGRHGRGRNSNGGRNPSDGMNPGDPNDPRPDVVGNPHSRMAHPQVAMQMQGRPMPMQPQFPMQAQYMPMGPGMLPPNQFMTRDRGLLGVPATQIPPQQQQGLLGDIPPEVLDYIRTGGIR